MKKPALQQSRFKIIHFENPRTGSSSYRVSGIKRDGTRIRENYTDGQRAQHRLIELESEYHSRAPQDSALRATALSDVQVKIAEAVFPRLDKDEDLYLAVDHWLNHGRHQKALGASPRLDEALKAFIGWLDMDSGLRDHTKRNLKIRVTMFT